MKVQSIKPFETEPWLLRKHYARRMPIITHSFGLFSDDNNLIGIVTYGPPSTPQIANGIWSKERFNLCELNRLVIDTADRNAASILVSASLKMLPMPQLVISYADGGVGHVGYVYQATNFIYTGAVTAHDCEYLVNGKKTHPRSLAAMGITNPAAWAAENGIEKVKPRPKHRYVFLCGNKYQKRKMIESLAYPIFEKYPKGESKRYDAGETVETQSLLF